MLVPTESFFPNADATILSVGISSKTTNSPTGKVVKYLERMKANITTKVKSRGNHYIHNFLTGGKKIYLKKKQETECQKFIDLYLQMLRVIESKKLYLDSKLTQEDVIRYLGTNRNYLYTALKTNSNLNFKGLLNQYRVRYAVSLIKDKVSDGRRFSLSDIYVDCGFSTNESFYRIFKKITGTTPGKYIAQIESEII